MTENNLITLYHIVDNFIHSFLLKLLPEKRTSRFTMAGVVWNEECKLRMQCPWILSVYLPGLKTSKLSTKISWSITSHIFLLSRTTRIFEGHKQSNRIENVWSVMKMNYNLIYHRARSATGMSRHIFYSISDFLFHLIEDTQKWFLPFSSSVEKLEFCDLLNFRSLYQLFVFLTKNL